MFFSTGYCTPCYSHYLEGEKEAAGHRSKYVFSSWQPRVGKLFIEPPTDFLFRNFVCSPPPSYQEVYAAERDQPPTYEDVVKQDTDTHIVQTQDEPEEQIEPRHEEIEHPDDQQMSDNLEQENNNNQDVESENPVIEENEWIGYRFYFLTFYFNVKRMVQNILHSR